jgi:hypothetical protein
MQDVPENVERRAPLCGVLSLAAPFAGFALACLVDRVYVRHAPLDAGFQLMAYVFFPIYGSVLCGLILAGAAALRHEKLWALRWIGFLVNASPFLYAIVASVAGY